MFYNFFFTLVLVFSPLFGQIHEIRDLLLFKETLHTLSSEDIVLFDIDQTVLTPKDSCLKPCCKELYQRLILSLDDAHANRLQSILALMWAEELVDDETPEIIKMLQSKKIPSMGFTALESGEFGTIAAIEDWRLDALKSFDIDFSCTFSDKSPTTLTMLTARNGHHPLFKNGVLFTNLMLKGEVLPHFIQAMQWKPRKIVFIDDSLRQHQSMEEACNNLGIEFQGFHYIAARCNPPNFDYQLGEFQLRYLIEHEHWLSEEEARSLLENK